jgi:integrase
MPTVRSRGNTFQAITRVPTARLADYGGREKLYHTLAARDRRTAKLEAAEWELALRAAWAEKDQGRDTSRAVLRSIYERTRKMAAEGTLELHGAEGDPLVAGVAHEIDKLADAIGEREPEPAEAARLAGFQDAIAELQRRPVEPRPELEPSFAETVEDYLTDWSTKQGLKPSNTRAQKEATYRLFGSFMGDRPIREVRRSDAARFMAALRRTNPHWSRPGRAKERTWDEVQREFGGQASGLSAATLNRHVGALQELWRWAFDHGRCEGNNPFERMRENIKRGRNSHGYLPWEPAQLTALFHPAPPRSALAEVMLVALFTGLRLNEIASLRHRQIKTAEGVTFLDIEDAKSPAGIRQVPLHPRLSWLAKREGEPDDRLWPEFRPEGPGEKPGGDAGRRFSKFKLARGFRDRRLAFHSFRKNVTQIFERAGVAENEAAQILGHERGFTYGRYSPHGITLARKAEVVGLIDYPGVDLPKPSSPSTTRGSR